MDIPRVKVGKTEISAIQYGWWKAGGPPYFKRPDLDKILAVRKCLLEHQVTSDNAPAYAKGLTEMFMWMGYSYLEDWWLETGRTTRREWDTVFTKCGLYWPAETRQNTHGDMHWKPELHLGLSRDEITPADIRALTHEEFAASCHRMHVDYIHGYMLHWPIAHADDTRADEWILEGVIPAFADLYEAGKIGAIGLGNATDPGFLKVLNERAVQEGNDRGLDGFYLHYIQNGCCLLDANKDESLVVGPLDDYCRAHDIKRVAYSALGHGAPIAPPGDFVFVPHWGIAEDVQKTVHAFKAEYHEKYKQLAADIKCSGAQLALAWVLSHDCIPLFSSMSPHHIEENLRSFEFIEKVSGMHDAIKDFATTYHKDLAEVESAAGLG